jgi:hypothetical protein
VSTYAPIGSGYACAICGAWVTPNASHWCGGSTIPLAPAPDPLLARIAAALERIADALESKPLAVELASVEYTGCNCGPTRCTRDRCFLTAREAT